MSRARSIKEVLEKGLGLKVYRGLDFPFFSLKKRFLSASLDLTNKCNLRCRMCHISFPTRKLSSEPFMSMSMSLFQKMASEVFPYTERLSLSCSTEPLMAENFSQYLTIAKGAHIPHVSMNTNGMLLKEKAIKECILGGLDLITLSLDGASKQTLEKIRRGAHFEQIIENGSLLHQLKEQYNSEKPRLELNMVLMRSNIEELPLYIDLARQLRADQVTCEHMVPFKGLNMLEESLFYHQDLTNQSLNEARKRAKAYNLSFTCPPNFNNFQGVRPPAGRGIVCLIPWSNLVIQLGGGVMPCGWWPEDKPLGNLNTSTFKEVWYGDGFQRLRDQLRRGMPEGRCLQCPSAGTGQVDSISSFQELDASWS